MDKLHTKDVDALFEAILSLKDLDECYKFFEDACTVKEIIEIERPIHASNVMIIDPKSKKGARIAHTTTKDGKKIRVSSKTKEKLD